MADSSTLPANLTSYDLLKTVAVVIMIVDHIGYYIFPDQLAWRAVGRTGFPVWFFLVGFAKGRDIPPKVVIGAFILLLANIVVGLPLLPLNALFTIMAIRTIRTAVAANTFNTLQNFFVGCLALTLMILPTQMLAEYGTLALITALYGYAVRQHPDGPSSMKRWAVPALGLLTFATFIVSQQLLFKFYPDLQALMTAGTGIVVIVLGFFRPVEWPRATAILPRPVTALVQFGGRRTLEIYVAHLLAFKLIAACLYPDRFHWFKLVVIT